MEVQDIERFILCCNGKVMDSYESKDMALIERNYLRESTKGDIEVLRIDKVRTIG